MQPRTRNLWLRCLVALCLLPLASCELLSSLPIPQPVPGPVPNPLPPLPGGLITLQIINHSTIPASVEAVFRLAGLEVRRTLRFLTAHGPNSTTIVEPTSTDILTVTAFAASQLNSRIESGDLLAAREYRYPDDFTGQTTIVFIIEPINDCNDNGIEDEQDILQGTSDDCQPNGIPDECDIASTTGSSLVRTTGKGDATNLLFPLDQTYALALGPNDDLSTGQIPLGFTFDLYGESYSSVYINNNGNISFGSPFGTFSSTGYPVDGFPMIAPFWADVDTRLDLGHVWYKLTANTLVVTWENVGYFDKHGDLRNTFQLAISDGLDPTIGIGKNVAFSYDDMQWTTGDASGGSGGFGGVPATVGANRGDGEDFFQIGRFSQPGSAYDGPVGAHDGIDFLDGKTYCFSTASENSNIAPIADGAPQNDFISITPLTGGMLNLSFSFLSPEAGQTTTVELDDVDNAQAAGLQFTTTPGEVAHVMLAWNPACEAKGCYRLRFTARDNFFIPGETTIEFTVRVVCGSIDCNDNGVPDECEDR
ncbi:MAG: hypothetical protein L6Q92_00675 [Phycisphaerae bacterium]|nr:hypothetical protein [Phycisphaerae bacterium]